MPETKWISAAVPPDLLKWYRAEAMRRTVESNGPAVTVSQLIRDALNQYRQRNEESAAAAFVAAFMKEPAA